jgi:hypothetical protein
VLLTDWRRRSVAAAIAALTSYLMLQASAASAYTGVFPKPAFGTPGAAAYCAFLWTDPENSSPLIFCWTPDDGWSVSLNWRGRRRFTRYYTKPPGIVHDIGVLKGYAPRAVPLRFGGRFVYRSADPSELDTCRRNGAGVLAFTCTSRASGLTCVNAARHGFWIGRYRGFRLF